MATNESAFWFVTPSFPADKLIPPYNTYYTVFSAILYLLINLSLSSFLVCPAFVKAAPIYLMRFVFTKQ